MASTVDVEQEESIGSRQDVNSGSYLHLHNSQIYEDGFSFSGNERDKLWINRGDGRGWADLSDLSGADSPNDGRAAIAADFDDDGDVDLFVHNIQRERHGLYRNDAAAGGFLKLRLRATRSGQYEAVGATVIVRGPKGPTAQVLTRGAGFVSCQPPELVFGLGQAAAAPVEVIWPGGARESFGELPSGSRMLLVEGTGAPEPYAARPRPLPDPLPPGLLVQEGEILPPLALLDADGDAVEFDAAGLADGKTLFVVFWGTFCGPCVAEIPVLQKMHAAGEVRVVAISMDVPEDVSRAEELLAARGAKYPRFYLDPKAGDEGIERIVDLLRLPLPTTLVVTPEGRIDTILNGPIRDDG